MSEEITDEKLDELRKRAAANAKRVRDEEREHDRALSREVADGYIAAAQRATGLTREQIIELTKEHDLGPKTIERAPIEPSALARRRMAAAAVPELHIRHMADLAPYPTKALEQVKDMIASSDLDLLVLAGAVDTSKTGSACWALGQVDDGEFVESVDLLSVKLEDHARWLRLKRASVVVLDDLGTESADGRDQFITAFNSFFNAAYARCAKLIITTNLTAEQFKSPPSERGYGERVVRRIRERGRWFNVGQDHQVQHWSDK